MSIFSCDPTSSSKFSMLGANHTVASLQHYSSKAYPVKLVLYVTWHFGKLDQNAIIIFLVIAKDLLFTNPVQLVCIWSSNMRKYIHYRLCSKDIEIIYCSTPRRHSYLKGGIVTLRHYPALKDWGPLTHHTLRLSLLKSKHMDRGDGCFFPA